jgi:hypothetical protein
MRAQRGGRLVAMSVKKFDLNIEEILEDWEVHHAVREVIANAIDEQLLTKTRGIEIFKDPKGKWHIRDYGRGLKYEHLMFVLVVFKCRVTANIYCEKPQLKFFGSHFLMQQILNFHTPCTLHVHFMFSNFINACYIHGFFAPFMHKR